LNAKNSDSAVMRVQMMLSVTKDPKSKIIAVSTETKSPQLSQQIVQQAALLLENFVQQKGHTRGGAKATFAEARLKESREEMAQAEEEFRRFLNSNRNFNTSGDPSVRLLGARLEAELRLRQQLVATLAMNREQALLEEKNDIPILNVLDAPSLPVLKSRPARALIVLLSMLLSTFGAWSWLNRNWIKHRLLEQSPLIPKEKV